MIVSAVALALLLLGACSEEVAGQGSGAQAGAGRGGVSGGGVSGGGGVATGNGGSESQGGAAGATGPGGSGALASGAGGVGVAGSSGGSSGSGGAGAGGAGGAGGGEGTFHVFLLLVAVPPLHECWNGALGPGDYFSKTLIDVIPPNDSIGLVPCAISGEKIETFMKVGGSKYAFIIQRAELA